MCHLGPSLMGIQGERFPRLQTNINVTRYFKGWVGKWWGDDRLIVDLFG